MNCFVHDRSPAVGVCAMCQKAVCRSCIARDTPRLVCQTCLEQRAVLGFEYRSSVSVAGWPLVHICAGVDPATMRPRVAKGIVAIGNIDGRQCDQAALEFFRQWVGPGALPPTCR